MPLRSSLALLLLLPLLALAQAKKKDPPPEKKGPTEPKVIAEDAMKKSDVKSRKVSELSAMPEGLEQAMSPQDLADLISYLESLKEGGVPPPNKSR